MKNEYITLNIKVKTNKNETKIVSRDNNFIYIDLKSLPIDGRANEELIKFLSKKFNTPKNLIELVRGEKSKTKALKLEMNDSITEFMNSISIKNES